MEHSCNLCGGRLAGVVPGHDELERKMWAVLREAETKRGLCRSCHAACLAKPETGGWAWQRLGGAQINYFMGTTGRVYVAIMTPDGIHGWYALRE